MQGLLDLFTVLIFLTVFIGVYVWRAFSKKQRQAEAITQRLRALKQDDAALFQKEQASDSIVAVQDTWVLSRLPVVGQWFAQVYEHLEILGWKPTLRLRLIVTAAAALVLGYFIGRRSAAPLMLTLIAGVMLFFIIALVGYKRAMKAHLTAMRTALPEAIDSITRACRAGVPLQSAFAAVAAHLRSPLTNEFLLIDNWLKLGVPLKRALQDSTQRVPIAEYRFFAVILIINQETGGRLGDTLERLSQTLRARAEMQLKVMSKTSEARASAKIVASLVPGVLAYMYVNAPNDFEFLLTDATGIKVLIYALCSVLLGLLITHLLVRKVA